MRPAAAWGRRAVNIRLPVIVALLPFALAALELSIERPGLSEGVHSVAAATAQAEFERHLTDVPASEAQQELQEFIAGVPGRLSVQIAGHLLWNPQLYRAGRVRIHPVGIVCGGPGSSKMSSTVQPPCAGSVCHGATARAGQEVSWNGVRITHVGRYQLCWCTPGQSCAGPEAGLTGPGCCREDADFSHHAGQVDVHGPAWVSLTPHLGNPFRIDMTGTVVHSSSRVQLRFRSPMGTGICGEPRSAAERKASIVEVSNSRFEDGKAKLQGRVYRGVQYIMCWCAGERHQLIDQDCADEESFSAEVGLVSPIGPHTEGLPPQHAVVGAPFPLVLRGLGLGIGDRVRIVDGSEQCGTEASRNAVPVSEYVCGRGNDPCVHSPVYDRPPSDVSYISLDTGNVSNSTMDPGNTSEVLEAVEAWQPVVVYTPGTYKLCWCVDNSWDSLRLDSFGLCGANEQFAVAAGTLTVTGIYDWQQFVCTSFAPCTLHLLSPMPMSTHDGIMIAAQRKDRWHFCGRGMQGLHALASSVQNTGKQNGSATFHILPNAGPAGEFPICFCQSSANGKCDDPAVFGQLAGTLRVQPPADGVLLHEEPTKFCHVNRFCRFVIVGMWAIQLHQYDAFGVVKKGTSCGSTDSLAIFRLEYRQSLPSGEWKAIYAGPFEDPWPQEPGDFRLCYCSASLVAGKVCASKKDFSQDMAGLVILGAQGSGHSWTCEQAGICNITVPGWRISPSDRLLLVQKDTPCGGNGYDDIQLTGGFDSNPATSPFIEPAARGVRAHFSFGQALGAGRSRVCFCASTTSASTCEDIRDFLQDVGEVNVIGALASVQMASSQPATAFAVSVIVDVLLPGQVTCAVTDASLTKPPSIYDVVYCQERLPGCLGVARLPWRALVGRNIIHIPLTMSDSVQAGQIAHAWCIGDPADCPATGFCAMPPTASGLEMILEDGSLSWTAQRMSVEEVINISIHGDPLLTRSGFAASHFDSDQDCDVYGRDDNDDVLALAEPTEIDPLVGLHWHSIGVGHPGRYRICWCDRSYAYDYCVRWHNAGLLTVAGPQVDAVVPPIVAAQEVYAVLLQGVDLTNQSRIRLVPMPSSLQFTATASDAEIVSEAGRACTNHSLAGLPNSSAPVWANGTSAQWNLSAPAAEGYFALCWGEVGMTMSIHIGHFYVQGHRDCLMSNWTRLPCDRICGGGVFEEYRWILQNATGGGQTCPSEEFMVRRWPCNTQPCPVAEAFRAWTYPSVVRTGEPFQVHVEGKDFAPDEDRLLLLAGEDDCNSSSLHLAGAGCKEPGSSLNELVCGDGKLSLRVADPGLYRICICDASKEVLGTDTVSKALNTTFAPCRVGSGTYTLTPTNGSVFRVIGPKKKLESFVDFEQEDSALNIWGNSREADDTEESADSIAMLVVIAAAVLGLNCVIVLAVWWRCCHQKTQLSNNKKSNQLDTEEIVRQATREVWNAYARAVAEGVDDEELRETSHAILQANAAAEEEEAACKEMDCANSVAASSRRWSLNSSSTDTSVYSGDETISSEMTSTGDCPTRATTPGTPGPSRVPTPTRTPPPTPGVSRVPTPSTAGRRTPTPGTGRTATGGSARTATPGTARTARSMASRASRGSVRSASRPSLLQVELPPPGKPSAPPKAGGSFLDMPLLGRSSTCEAKSVATASAPAVLTTPPPEPSGEPPALDVPSEHAVVGLPATTVEPQSQPLSAEPPRAEQPPAELPPSPPVALGTQRPKTPVGRPPPLTMLELPTDSELPQGPLAGTPQSTPPGSPPDSSRQVAVDEVPTLEASRAPLSSQSSSTMPSATARPPGFNGGSLSPLGMRPPSRSLLPGHDTHIQQQSLPLEPMDLLSDLKLGSRAATVGIALPTSLPPPPPPPQPQTLSVSEEAAAFIRSLGAGSHTQNETTSAAHKLSEEPDTPTAPSSQNPALDAAAFIRSLGTGGRAQTETTAADHSSPEGPDTPTAPSSQHPVLDADADAECKPPDHLETPTAPSLQAPPLSCCQDNDDEPFKDTRSTWSGIGNMLHGSLALAASPSSKGSSVEMPVQEPSSSQQAQLQKGSDSSAETSEAVRALSMEPSGEPVQDERGQLPGQTQAGIAEKIAKAQADSEVRPSADLQAEPPADSSGEPQHCLHVAQDDGETRNVLAAVQATNSSAPTDVSRASGWSFTNFVGKLRMPWSQSRGSKAARVSALPLAAIAEGTQHLQEQEHPSDRGLEPQEALRSKHQPLQDASEQPKRQMDIERLLHEPHTPDGRSTKLSSLAADDMRYKEASEAPAECRSSKDSSAPTADDVMLGDAASDQADKQIADKTSLREVSAPVAENATPGDVFSDQAVAENVPPEDAASDHVVEPVADSTRPREVSEPVADKVTPRETASDQETLGSVSPSTQEAGRSPALWNTPGSRLDGFLSDDGASPTASNVASQRSSRCGQRDDLHQQHMEDVALETGRTSSTMPTSRSFGVRSGAASTQEKIRADWYKKLKAETDWDGVSRSPKSTSLRPRGDASARPSASSLRSAASRSSPKSSQAPSAVASPRSLSTPGPETASAVGAPGPALHGMPGPAFPGMPGPSLPGMPGPALPGMPGPALPGMPGPALPGMRGPSLLPGPASASSPKGQMLSGPPLAAAPGQGPHRLNPHGRSGAPGGRRPPSWAFAAP